MWEEQKKKFGRVHQAVEEEDGREEEWEREREWRVVARDRSRNEGNLSRSTPQTTKGKTRSGSGRGEGK